jgi:hypothetical protein
MLLWVDMEMSQTRQVGLGMDTIEGDPPQGGGDRMQDFIFGRELAEVYLLLDYISGRSEKSLTATIGEKPGDGDKWIEEICEIRWPPEGTKVAEGLQAKTLLLAKDRLNALTKPATGASIVFTLMVAGDDDEPPVKLHHNRWWSGLGFWQSAASPMPGNGNLSPNSTDGVGQGPANSVSPEAEPRPASPSPGGGGGGSGGVSRPGGIFGGHPPSRISLARFAYPGLIKSARQFRRLKDALLLLLFLWLIATCVLSWHITAGREILARLDAIETARTGTQKKIADIQAGPASPTSVKKSKTSGSSKLPVTHYCDGVNHVSPKGEKFEQFADVTQLQICDALQENRINYANAREDLADWLAPWEWVKGFSHWICGGERCLHDPTVVLPADTVNQQQWAIIVANVLATAVLPLCYGFLGAGAAVVRSIWGKMKDSLLSPRDVTLSAGQLALGAVVGACIGLFIAPSTVAGSQGANGLALGMLTPSALSFVAGFGVEGVFVALESLVKRVFNIPDPKP